MKTYSAAVNLALAEVPRVKKIQNLTGFFGQVHWQGNLSQMREDQIGPAFWEGRGQGREKG